MSPIHLAPDSARRLGEGLFILSGAVSTGLLISGSRALLIDCCDSVTPERLAALGVRHVDFIACTQHRRPNVAGAYAFVEGGTKLLAPQKEQHRSLRLFENAGAYWADLANRWHIHHHQPGPQVLATDLLVSRALQDGDVVRWGDFALRVLETPGATEGSVSFVDDAGTAGLQPGLFVDCPAGSVCFSGDAIYGPGLLWDLWSLQRGHAEILEYHGFLGNMPHWDRRAPARHPQSLLTSLRKLTDLNTDLFIPSHGNPIRDPGQAIRLLAGGPAPERLSALWDNYTTISSINYYFPGLLNCREPTLSRMEPVSTVAPPPHIRRTDVLIRVGFTSFAVISEGGQALLTDCGDVSVVQTLEAWLRAGQVTAIDGCWVTHYHDDHVDALGELVRVFGCPIICDSHLADVLENPDRYFLPCISPHAVPVDRMTRHEDSWHWREFVLTAYHLPGQTYYGGGLLVEGRGSRVFFAGDSVFPGSAGLQPGTATSWERTEASAGAWSFFVRLTWSGTPVTRDLEPPPKHGLPVR